MNKYFYLVDFFLKEIIKKEPDKSFASNIKTDVLFRKLDLDSQWHAMNYILNLLTEKQKIQIRKQLRQYKKEQYQD